MTDREKLSEITGIVAAWEIISSSGKEWDPEVEARYAQMEKCARIIGEVLDQ